MIYAEIEDGKVVRRRDTHDLDHWVFRRFRKFKTLIRIDLLDPQPQVGWNWTIEDGFSED